MNREHWHLDGKAEGKGSKEPGLQVCRDIHLSEMNDAETILEGHTGLNRVVVNINDSNQHQERADCGKDKEFNRCIDAILATPDTDHEIHRHQHQLPENIEEEQVKRDECAEHAGFEKKCQSHKALGVLINSVPGRKNGDRHNEGRQHHKPEADAVDTDIVVHLEIVADTDPISELCIVHRRRGYKNIVERQRQTDEENDDRYDQRNCLDQSVGFPRQEEDNQHPHQREKCHQAKKMVIHGSLLLISTLERYTLS